MPGAGLQQVQSRHDDVQDAVNHLHNALWLQHSESIVLDLINDLINKVSCFCYPTARITNTALHIALWRGYSYAIIKRITILQGKTTINRIDESYYPALNLALRHKASFETILFLVNQGACTSFEEIIADVRRQIVEHDAYYMRYCETTPHIKKVYQALAFLKTDDDFQNILTRHHYDLFFLAKKYNHPKKVQYFFKKIK